MTSTATFGPQTSLTVIDSVNVSSGNISGANATLNSFYNELGAFTLIPEPGSYSYMLVGLGFSLVGISGKWIKKRA